MDTPPSWIDYFYCSEAENLILMMYLSLKTSSKHRFRAVMQRADPRTHLFPTVLLATIARYEDQNVSILVSNTITYPMLASDENRVRSHAVHLVTVRSVLTWPSITVLRSTTFENHKAFPAFWIEQLKSDRMNPVLASFVRVIHRNLTKNDTILTYL